MGFEVPLLTDAVLGCDVTVGDERDAAYTGGRSNCGFSISDGCVRSEVGGEDL